MRKHIALLSAALLAFAGLLSACGGTNTPAPTAAPESQATEAPATQAPADATEAPTPTDAPATDTSKTTLTIYMSKVEISDQLVAAAEEFSKTSGYKVDVWGTPGDSYTTQLQAKLTGGQGPVIFQVGGDADVELFGSYLEDLSSESYTPNIVPGGAFKNADGKVVAIPLNMEGFGIVYNKNLVAPEDLTNLDTFTAKLTALKESGVNPFSLSKEGYFLVGHILNTPFALQSDPKAFMDKLNKGEVKMKDDPIFQEFAKFMEVIRAQCKNPMETTYDSQMADFATGKSAMVHQGNWANGMLADYSVDFEYDMMGLPLGGNTKIAVGYPGGWAINSQKAPEEIAAGKAFLKWLFETPEGQRYITEEFKFIPTITTIAPPQLDPLSKAVLEKANAGETLVWATNWYPSGIVDTQLAPVAQKFFLTPDMTGEQFLEELDKAWTTGATTK